MRSLRRQAAPVAFLTLIIFWNAILQTVAAQAQQAGEGSTPAPAPAPAPAPVGTNPSPGATAPPPPPEDVERTLAALPTGGGSVSPQATALPSGAATQLGMGESFTTQLSTGGAGYSIPLVLPSARGRVQPRLDLSYSSSGGFGLAGVGWNVGAAAITRQTDRGLPRYDDRADWHPEQDRFAFGGMELVPICTVSGGNCAGALPGEVMPVWANRWQYFRARIEGGFLRFFWSPDHRTWRAQGKDGANMELGVPLDGSGYDDALESNPDNPAEISRWYLVRQYDPQGGANDAAGPTPVNLIQYRYLRHGGGLYLSDLYDTPPAQGAASAPLLTYAHHTRLAYEARPDVAVSYRAGFRTEAALRLARVDVTSKPFGAPGQTGDMVASAPRELVRRYHFAYDAESHRSLLTSAQMEGQCATDVQENAAEELPLTECPRLPAMRFEYAHVEAQGEPLRDAQGQAFDPFVETVEELASSPPHSLDEALSDLADIDADGLPDVFVTAAGLYQGRHGLYRGGLSTGGRFGFAALQTMPVEPAGDAIDANVLKLGNVNVTTLDLDADGIVNLVHMPKAKSYSVFAPEETQPGSRQYRWRGRAVRTASRQDLKIDFTHDSRDTRVMDVNGDGLVDVVHSSPTEMQTFFALGRYAGGDDQFGQAHWTSSNTADISNDPVLACAPWSSTPVRFSDPDTHVADLNGDGLPDLARVRSGQLLYWPGRGNGFFGTGDRDDCAAGSFAEDRHVQMLNPPRFGEAQPGRLLLSDINGDGLSDLVEVRSEGVDIYLNDNGDSWTARHTIANTPFLPASSSYVRLTDINGSGTPDILWGRAQEYRYIDLTGGVTPHLLTRVHNGLGKTLELEYQSSTEHMLAAQAAGSSWSSRAPLSIPLLVRSTVRDNLEQIGRPAGAHVAEYSYRDPYYEGRQREFRGFREATVKAVGDLNSPTMFTRSRFLLGECPENYYSGDSGDMCPPPPSQDNDSGGSGDVCSPPERWQDNWREALKGLPILQETFDEQGVYLATEHTSYSLRQLYTGRDGRRVVAALPTVKDAFAYDTASFDGAASCVELDDVVRDLVGIGGSEPRRLTLRASAGTAHVQSRTDYDDFGNTLVSTRSGCVSGCPNGADETITAHSDFVLPAGDGSGWLWRERHSYIQGSASMTLRNELTHSYDSRGQVQQSYATLSGTLSLDRSHETGAALAPAPPDQSAGTSAPVQVLLTTNTYDSFGHLVFSRAPNGRCTSGEVDAAYAHLPVTARAFVGASNGDNCGAQALVHTVRYDRGLEAVVSSVDVTGQPSEFSFDGFGRLVATRRADPDNPGQLASLPTMTVSYTLPADPVATPYTVTTVRVQDGATPNVNSYVESWSYADGLGRAFVTLKQADPTAGDLGQWLRSGEVSYDQKGAQALSYDPTFYAGDPQAAPLTPQPLGPATAQQYDAFGRPTLARDAGVSVSRAVHHALTLDVYDAADLEEGGAHADTYITRIGDGHGRVVGQIERIKVGSSLELRATLSEYLPTGEVARVVLRRSGSPDVVRWLRYDSLGRLVLNAEPNTSTNFNPDPNTPASAIKAWRYAYNDAGDLVGDSDARGCGTNYHYDMGGRMLAEDRSPCLATHAAYSAPDLPTGDGTELFYRYDSADPDAGAIVDAAGQTLPIDAGLLKGRVASVSSLGSKGVLRYDARGRATGGALRMQKPGKPPPELSQRYAPRWYVTTQTLDAADRTTLATTGMTVPELRGDDATSELRYSYSKRGAVKRIESSYGLLLDSMVHRPDGLVEKFKLGDAAGTERFFTYDIRKRVQSVQSYRGNLALWSNPPSGSDYTPPAPTDDPTSQLLLEDYQVVNDVVGNPIEIQDHRLASDWPSGSKPVTRRYSYDDLYRLTEISYVHADGSDSWRPPFAAEHADVTRTQPSPQVSFATRVTQQSYQYDWLGNISQSTDDQQGFWDRSTGDRVHGAAGAAPHRISSASNRSLAPSSPAKGDLDVSYDDAGNVRSLTVRRDGNCLPAGASCWQRFDYEWDEVGQLARARRYDLQGSPVDERTLNGAATDPLPERAPDAELLFGYDGSGSRVLKTAVDATGQTRHTVYVSGSLELRSTGWDGTDYVLSAATASLRLPAGPASARVIWTDEDLPSITTSHRHTFLELSDYLGSGTFTIDHATSELAELATYQAYGATDSDYRTGRWADFREPYKFSGKEEDIELGLQYFGARYYSAYLGVWMSPDPATIHGLEGDSNPYAYVHGRPTAMVDPDGRFAWLAVLAVALIAGAVSAVSQAANNNWNFGAVNWGFKGVVGAMIVGAVAAATGGAIAVGNGIAGAIVGGAVGGYSSYVTGGALGMHEMTSQGVGLAMLGGAVSGGAGVLAGAAAGEALNKTLAGAMVGGAVGGATGYLYGGIVGNDWSVKAFALGFGSSTASAVATYGLLANQPKPKLIPGRLLTGGQEPGSYKLSTYAVSEMEKGGFDQLQQYQQQKAAGNFKLDDVTVHGKNLTSVPAYTTNNDINIDADQWNNNMMSGNETANLDLLVHEATHSLQYSLMPLGLLEFGVRYSNEIIRSDSYNYSPSAQPPLSNIPLRQLDVTDPRFTLDGIAEHVRKSRPGSLP
jgi:RHS repeat-associated protein